MVFENNVRSTYDYRTKMKTDIYKALGCKFEVIYKVLLTVYRWYGMKYNLTSSCLGPWSFWMSNFIKYFIIDRKLHCPSFLLFGIYNRLNIKTMKKTFTTKI